MYGRGQSLAAPDPFAAVAIVASAGGLRAVSVLVEGLPADFPASTVVVQHGATPVLAALLSRRTPLAVRVGDLGDELDYPGLMVLLPGADARSDPHPADRVLTAMAACHGPRLITVVLTGRLDDGAAGVRATKRAGGRVIVQDPATAVAPGMPSAALATGCVDFVLPLERIPHALIALTMAPGGADLLAVPAPSWAAYA